jgi:hypothetical protein
MSITWPKLIISEKLRPVLVNFTRFFVLVILRFGIPIAHPSFLFPCCVCFFFPTSVGGLAFWGLCTGWMNKSMIRGAVVTGQTACLSDDLPSEVA